MIQCMHVYVSYKPRSEYNKSESGMKLQRIITCSQHTWSLITLRLSPFLWYLAHRRTYGRAPDLMKQDVQKDFIDVQCPVWPSRALELCGVSTCKNSRGHYCV